MALFSVFVGRKAQKQLDRLQPKIRQRVIELTHVLEANPKPYQEYDLKKLEGRNDEYRIRLSRFRVIYQVIWDTQEVWIGKIERRTDSTYD